MRFGAFVCALAAYGQRYPELVQAGLLTVRHLDGKARALLYGDLVRTCDLPRLYGDDLTRTIWRSKRVLDFVYSVRLASLTAPDYVLVLEDDTPVVGSLHAGATQCAAMFGNSTTACRWDFHWEKRVALTKVFPVEHEASTRDLRFASQYALPAVGAARQGHVSAGQSAGPVCDDAADCRLAGALRLYAGQFCLRSGRLAGGTVAVSAELAHRLHAPRHGRLPLHRSQFRRFVAARRGALAVL